MDKENMNPIPEEENTEETAVQPEEAQETAASELEQEYEKTEIAPAEEDAQADGFEEASEDEMPEEADEEEKAEEIDGDELCPICGENKIEEDSDYCSECEAKMLSRKAPFLGWVSGLLAVVMSVFAFVLVILVSAQSIQVAKGDFYAKENCWYSAYKAYSEVSSVVEEINSILGEASIFTQTGSGLNVKMIETVAKCYSPLEAITVADSLLGDDFASRYPSLKKYEDIRAEYVAAYEALMAPIEAMSYGEADAATTYAAMEAVRGTEGVKDVYIDWFLYNAAYYYGDEKSVQLKYLEALDENVKASGEDYSWLYYQDIAELLFNMGETERALGYLDVLAENDKSKFGAYELKMKAAIAAGDVDEASRILAEFKQYNEGYDTAYVLEAMFLRVTGETEKAKELLTEALEQYDSVPELHRQLALVYLLEGDYDSAYESVFTADNTAYYLYAYMNDSSAYTDELSNALYLCTYLAKNNGTGTSENAAYFDDILDSYSDSELSEQVKAVVNGEKTVDEVLTEGVCDLA